MIDMLRLFGRHLKYRKGNDKPIYILAAITLAILFIALFYSASSGWLESVVEQFTSNVDTVSTGSSGG